MIFPTMRMCKVQYIISGMIYSQWQTSNWNAFIMFRSILVYNCNDNNVFVVLCVHGNYLSHCQTGKKHQIDLIKYTYNRQIVTNENK